MGLTLEEENDMKFEGIVEQYQDMIWNISAKYNHKTSAYNVRELYNFGLFGLWKAYLNFDPTKNQKFSTYAYQNISGHILNEINREKELELDLPRVYRKRDEKLTYFIQMKEVNGWTWKETQKQSGLTEEEWDEALRYHQEKLSLFGEYENANKAVELIDLIPGELGFEEKIIAKEEVKEMYSFLDDIEKQIIHFRYVQGYNKAESAKKLNIPKTTFSRKEEKTLNKIINQKRPDL